ncbi:MAG TPA: C4-dicarboxylic acid transporter DauA [Planctomycetota bacterium]|nr:C4-dicarboxylic acid transporter DauA [Planctomycetota bacterium]
MPRTRYFEPDAGLPWSALPAAALRAALKEGYGRDALRSDVLAGLVVGVVALPLAMALAINVGAPPQHGLYTAIVAGFLIALLGGSRTQVSGPTAAFVVILAPICAQYGMGGLLTAGAMAGVMLAALGLLRLGRLIQFVPHPVTTGFTAGIAVVIATFQVKDFLGLRPAHLSDHYFERVAELWSARGTLDPWDLALGAFTLALLIACRRWVRTVPAPLIALPAAAAAAAALRHFFPEASVDTIAGRFHTVVGGREIAGIPQIPPMPVLPWTLGGPGGAPFRLDFDTIQALLPKAFAIALLGAVESLLSAVVADGMSGTRHDPDAELVAQGLGNLVAPFFGGIPATGAIARTATNIRSGARSPVASMVHALTILAAVLGLAPLLGYLPMASLAALLLLVAWNMSEAKHFLHTLRVAPRGDVAVLLVCFGLTVAIDMVVSVTVGIVLAALLFMQRMASMTRARIVGDAEAAGPVPVPPGVVVYDIAGPLFFGAAERAIAALGIVTDRVRAIVLRMDQVPYMDATGLVALESALERLERRGVTPILAGVQRQPRRLLRRAGLKTRFRTLRLRSDLGAAVELAARIAGAGGTSGGTTRLRLQAPPSPA